MASSALLPPPDPQRSLLHNEVHARPPARVRAPALATYVAVMHEGVSRAQECEHLRRLPGQQALELPALEGGFVRLRAPGCLVKWERHTEFSRYTIVQPLPEGLGLGTQAPDLAAPLATPPGWLAAIPARTFCAIQIGVVAAALDAPEAVLAQARHWLGAPSPMASFIGRQRHALVASDLQLRPDGFERMLIVAAPDASETRIGRVFSRLLELETYRLMALRGLPVAKQMAPLLGAAEQALAGITARLEGKDLSEQQLLDTLVSLAARVERATAEHSFRFSATRAYDALVGERMAELQEQSPSGTQTLGEFIQRRLSPAMATVAAAERRLASLSERVARASALLRTRVDIATEAQNNQLLEKLTRGQALQLRLQSTVEGLSIAAISYYVVSLLLYVAKAAKAAGLPIHPELAAGALIPVVLWGVWHTVRRIHEKLHAEP